MKATRFRQWASESCLIVRLEWWNSHRVGVVLYSPLRDVDERGRRPSGNSFRKRCLGSTLSNRKLSLICCLHGGGQGGGELHHRPTGWHISWQTSVGLTLILAVPLSAWFCLSCWEIGRTGWARWWNIPNHCQPNLDLPGDVSPWAVGLCASKMCVWILRRLDVGRTLAQCISPEAGAAWEIQRLLRNVRRTISTLVTTSSEILDLFISFLENDA